MNSTHPRPPSESTTNHIHQGIMVTNFLSSDVSVNAVGNISIKKQLSFKKTQHNDNINIKLKRKINSKNPNKLNNSTLSLALLDVRPINF
jgi:hypothetical protein